VLNSGVVSDGHNLITIVRCWQ